MGIKDDPLCIFCKTHVETTVHLLWDCSITKDFFKSFLSWLRSFHIYIELSEKLFLFGLESGKKVSNVSKFILLYAKYYIYCSRYNNHSLMLEIFKKKLYFMYKIHMEIAITIWINFKVNGDHMRIYLYILTPYQLNEQILNKVKNQSQSIYS